MICDGDLSADPDFYIVVSTVTNDHDMAVVEVVKGEKVITRLFCGAIFGEKPFLTRNLIPRSASVRISAELNIESLSPSGEWHEAGASLLPCASSSTPLCGRCYANR